MTFTIHAWQLAAVSIVLCLWLGVRLADSAGDWDFMTPILGAALAFGPMLLWGAYFLGVWLG